MKRIVTFSNLFPSSVMPTHGVFVYERMHRVAKATGLGWSVVAPVPGVVRPLRYGRYRQWANVPALESWRGVGVFHPRFSHWPGLSQRRQAKAVAKAARDVVGILATASRVVIDAHYLWPDGVAAAALADAFDLPFTLTARGSDVNVLAQDEVIAARIAEAASRAHACMAVSDALGARFAEIAQLPRERVVTVRNGVDLERFRPGDQAAARAQLGLPASGRIVLGVGRLVPGKGFDRAASAVRGLDDTRLVLIGEGAERERIARAGGDRVTFYGPAAPERVALAYRAADVLVLPSEREGWPNVVTEALASGLPVVATRVGGIPQIFGDDPPACLGRLVPPGDDEALLAALREVLAAGVERAEVRRFAERYGWQEPVAQLVGIFRQALGEPSA